MLTVHRKNGQTTVLKKYIFHCSVYVLWEEPTSDIPTTIICLLLNSNNNDVIIICFEVFNEFLVWRVELGRIAQTSTTLGSLRVQIKPVDGAQP
jgi:hypothetical protein